MDDIKLKVVEVMKSNDSNESNEMVFDNILGTTLDPIFKEMDRLLAMKQIEGSKQHIIISGEMAEIEWVQNMIRRRFREQKHLKVKEESIHFAKSKRAKGAALFDIITPKNQTLAYRANKSWCISVQRDFIPELDDRNKRIKGTENGQWVVNGVFHEIIRMGEMVRANHCEVVWVQPIHDRKIQIDVYSNDSLAVHQGDGGVLYIEDCQYEGYVHVFVFDDVFSIGVIVTDRKPLRFCRSGKSKARFLWYFGVKSRRTTRFDFMFQSTTWPMLNREYLT